MSELQIINSDSQEIDKRAIDYYNSIAPQKTEIEKAMEMESPSADINKKISVLSQLGFLDANLISDGYHTFGELYEHRIQLWISLCKAQQLVRHYQQNAEPVWRTFKHSDGTLIDGWFLLGIGRAPGQQITYHLPSSKWCECDFAIMLDKAPEFDGHTSADVLERLKSL